MIERIALQTPDDELVVRVLEGQLNAFELLMRRSNPALYKVGRAYGFSHEETEDLMQEAHLRAYQHLAAFERRATYKTWVLRILLNLCYQRRQKASRKHEVVQSEPLRENAIPMYQSPLSNDAQRHVLNRELGRLLEQALAQLPLDYRMVFTLRELNGLSGAEAAEALGISPDNVKMRLSRTKAMLRRALEKMYSPEEVYEFNLVYCDRIIERVLERLTFYAPEK